jgi:hypothetical protein
MVEKLLLISKKNKVEKGGVAMGILASILDEENVLSTDVLA